ncbi:MAG: hypothetical protein OEO79_09490 [Gemmatimonadota bacterium]|nr:hypothetical protein [Gemmatimonadota bacterium]
MKPPIPWLRIVIEGVVIVGGILRAGPLSGRVLGYILAQFGK